MTFTNRGFDQEFSQSAWGCVYNWWHLYVRLHDGAHHREAITSRPALLGGVEIK